MELIRFIDSRSAPSPVILSAPLNFPPLLVIAAIVVLALLAALVATDGGSDAGPPANR